MDEAAEWLDELSTWLSQRDQDKIGVLIECAARDLRAGCWLLKPDDGSRPEAWLTSSNGTSRRP
jgi:hypothetical protein